MAQRGANRGLNHRMPIAHGLPERVRAAVAAATAAVGAAVAITAGVERPAVRHDADAVFRPGIVVGMACRPANSRLRTCSGRAAASSSSFFESHFASSALMPAIGSRSRVLCSKQPRNGRAWRRAQAQIDHRRPLLPNHSESVIRRWATQQPTMLQSCRTKTWSFGFRLSMVRMSSNGFRG